MKKITVMALAAFAASIMASCCCQDQGAPPLTPLPKFNDLNQPAVDVAPVVMKSKNPLPGLSTTFQAALGDCPGAAFSIKTRQCIWKIGNIIPNSRLWRI